MTNEQNNSNNGTKNNLSLSNSDEIVVTEADDKKVILELAHKQKALFDEARLEWQQKDREKDQKQLKLLIENGQIKKQLDGLTKTVDALKYQAVLDQEIGNGLQRQEPARQLSKEEKVHQVLAEVVKELKVEAQEKRNLQKDSNIFYI